MFRPAGTAMERGWVGRVDGDEVVHLAAQTLQHLFSGAAPPASTPATGWPTSCCSSLPAVGSRLRQAGLVRVREPRGTRRPRGRGHVPGEHTCR